MRMMHMHATRGPCAPVTCSLTRRHVFINTGDVVQNATDLLSAKEAMPLFKDQEAKLQAGLAELNETLGPRLGQASALCSLALCAAALVPPLRVRVRVRVRAHEVEVEPCWLLAC